jgi:hypothetical protein
MAVLITWEDVVATMKGEPLIETFDQHSQDLVFEDVELSVNVTAFPSVEAARISQRYYAAHVAALMIQVSAGQGTVSGESIGELSASYTMPVNNPMADDNIRSTWYGRHYIDHILPKFLPRGAVG